MKNLPATIGLLMVLAVFFLLQSNLDRRLQANPVDENELVKQSSGLKLFQDTFPPKVRDTVSPESMKMKKKEMKDKKKDLKKQNRDAMRKQNAIM
ncbi:hypothetical protein [Chitinophaga flava]|uniref:Uncharacterized protein n=1 Tax=Chitinophaga flava TaxID=2259036 RepID=A0A365XY48_9BACT|nr:hypothetical protein [Chitinophaga flava]RBL91296.1 hypothetical protein DF182_01340 [Chitinophaga flava]